MKRQIKIINLVISSLFVLQLSGCFFTSSVINSGINEAGGIISEIDSAYLYDEKVYFQFQTKDSDDLKWTYLEYKEVKRPEGCDCGKINKGKKGHWTSGNIYDVSYGKIPSKYKKEGIQLPIEKRIDYSNNDLEYWVIFIPAWNEKDYSEIIMKGIIQAEDKLSVGKVLILPFAIAGDIVLFPVLCVGTTVQSMSGDNPWK